MKKNYLQETNLMEKLVQNNVHLKGQNIFKKEMF